MKSSTLEENVIDVCNLRTGSGEKLSPDELDRMMVAKRVKDSESIEIKVEHGNSKMTKETEPGNAKERN